MSPQVDAADAEVIARPDIAGLELQGSAVRSHCFLTLVPVGQGGPKLVPEQIVLGKGRRGLGA